MKDPKCKRYHRKCDSFSICVNIGEEGYVLAEHSNERYCSFYYVVEGRGKFGRLYDPDYLMMESKNIYNVQDYMNDSVVFQALENFHLIGFNTLDKSIKWENITLNQNIKNINLTKNINFILCLNKSIKVNNNLLKRYDYAMLEKNKKYDIDILNDGEYAIFSQL